MPAAEIPHVFSRRFRWAGYLLGFALGGFFDGILLHQILQWHHVLSLVDAEPLRDLRAQVVADGVFHAIMYAVAAVGLWLLYRSRNEFTGAEADRNLVADGLIGFGVWHVIDAVLFHWVLEIHHIRLEVPNPIAWDVGWMVVFGLIPIALGVWMQRHYPTRASIADRRGRHPEMALSLAALALASGWLAALPPDPGNGSAGAETVTVVLRPGVRPGEFLSALGETDVRIIGSDRAGRTWVLASAGSPGRLRFYQYGALYVSGSILPAGCSAWIKA